MKVARSFRTHELAAAGGISVQQVRNYEASGLIPPVERSPSGYRRYTERHRAALVAARGLVAGYGWARTRAIMAALGAGDLAAALALIDEHHAELAARRRRSEQTLAALATLAAQAAPEVPARRAERLRVGEAASAVGVRVSALRFWEGLGLLHPSRDASSRYRLYDERQLRRLRVVALLREADYGFDAIRTTLDELAAGRAGRAIAAVEGRRAEIARESWGCLAALASLRAYIDDHCPDLADAL